MPTLSVADVSAFEGYGGGNGMLVFTVESDLDTERQLTVNCATSTAIGDLAQPGTDYTKTQARLPFQRAVRVPPSRFL